ncbi:MAG TPA: putative Ig domain-containing protein, partial [Chthoniobacterales bacterium]
RAGSITTDAITTCADIGAAGGDNARPPGNDFAGQATGGVQDLGLRRLSAAANSHLKLYQYDGVAGNLQPYIQGRNVGSPTVINYSGALEATASPCATPVPAATPPPVAAPLLAPEAAVSKLPGKTAEIADSSTLPAPVLRNEVKSQKTSLTQSELNRVTAEAVATWRATGLSEEQLSKLARLNFTVADLSDRRLGETDGDTIRVDADANGNGWNIAGESAAGAVDLQTTIMHEIGHALGLADTYEESDRANVMFGILPIGERRLPAHGQALSAKPGSLAGPHFLGSPVNIGTLPPGKSVKILYSVTVGPISGNPQSVSSQGAVSGSNFATVQTSDVGAGSGPTVTLLAIPPTITSANATTFTVGSAGTFTVTANGAPAPTFSHTGTLPSGVTFTAGGVLSGTPAAGTGGTYPITITANNGVAPNGTQSFTLTVNQPPAITSTNNATFVAGTAGTFTVTTTGFPTPSVTQTGTLPNGVTFDSSTKTLSGTPAAGSGGTYSITFTAANSVGSNAVQSFTLTVNEAPAITSANNATFTVGTPASLQVTATGYPSPTFAINGTLPAGVTLGAVSG